jgi:Domain of unknown function (DUF4388)
MALKGTLKDFSLADIFQLIGIQKKTGVLTLKSDKEVVTVSFLDGSVVAADSLHRRLEDRLGSVLVKSGRITEGQLQEALRIQKNTLKRMGNILVESRFIDAAGLRDALQTQISQMVYRLFRWRNGEYDFSQEQKVDYDSENVAPMTAESILMEGARILDEWPMIEKAIRSTSAVFRRANVEIAAAPAFGGVPEGEEAARGVTLNDQERQVHGAVDGKRTVQEIVDRSTLGEFETCRILYELINRQLIEEVRSPGPKIAAAPTPPPAREMSPILLGIGYLVLAVVVGGAFVFRTRTLVKPGSQAVWVRSALTPFIRPADLASIQEAIDRVRLQRIDFALQVYYLANREYPPELRLLVSSRLLDPDGIIDPWGRPYRYDFLGSAYHLEGASGPIGSRPTSESAPASGAN